MSEKNVELHESVGQNVFRRRQAIGKSQRELSVLVGVGIGGIIHFEHGQGMMSVKLLCLVSKVLNVSASTIVEEAEYFIIHGKWPSEIPTEVVVSKQSWFPNVFIHRISDESPIPEPA